MVLFIETSSIVDAILLKKRILTLFSNFFSKTINNFGQDFAARAGLLQINIENELKTDKNILMLKTHMDAGHFSSSGRYDYLKDVAFYYAFALDQLGINK